MNWSKGSYPSLQREKEEDAFFALERELTLRTRPTTELPKKAMPSMQHSTSGLAEL